MGLLGASCLAETLGFENGQRASAAFSRKRQRGGSLESKIVRQKPISWANRRNSLQFSQSYGFDHKMQKLS